MKKRPDETTDSRHVAAACGYAGFDCGGPGGGELPGFSVAMGGG